MTRTLRVLIVDDHRMFTDALEMLLATEEGVEALGAVGTAAEALELCRRTCPDVVLMDLDLPGMDGAEATARVRELCPEARVVAITGIQDRTLIARAVRAGISGFVSKTRAADELMGVIRAAAEGEIVPPPATRSASSGLWPGRRRPGASATRGTLSGRPSSGSPRGNARSSRLWPRGSRRTRWPPGSPSAPAP